MAKDKKKKKNDIQPRSDKKKVQKKVSGTSPKAKGINTNRKSQKKRQHIPRKKKKKRRYKTKKKKTTSARSSSPTDQYAGRRGMKTSRPFEASIAVNGFVGIVLKNHGEILMKVKRSPTSNPWNAISCKGWNNSPKRLIE